MTAGEATRPVPRGAGISYDPISPTNSFLATLSLSQLQSQSQIEGFKTYSDGDGSTLSTLLDGQRVRLTKVGTPVTSADGENSELGDGDSGTDGSSDFLRGLDTETDVALRVTDEDDGLEAGTLTGTGLLLDGFDLYCESIR